MQNNTPISSQNTLKIGIGYHKPSVLLKGDCFVPIWGGRAVANEQSKEGKGLAEEEKKWMQQHCIGDDDGENISIRNHQYCEATLLYWMWKNYDKLGNPDYIGFMQYRRHFVLDEHFIKKYFQKNIYNLIVEDEFSPNHQEKIGLNEQALLEVLKSYDGIFCSNETTTTVYEYKQNHHSQDIKYWDAALDIIKKDWPQYAPAAEKYNNGTRHVWSNCFVMKKEDFLEYCPFLFDVLAKIDALAQKEYDTMTIEQMRVPAYVSETMLGIFYTYLRMKNENLKTVPLLYIKKPFAGLDFLSKTVSPVNPTDVAITMIADKNYIKYTAVTLQSLFANTGNIPLDIVILEDGSIDDLTKQRIASMIPQHVSCRFFTAAYYIKKYHFERFWYDRLNMMPYLKGFLAEIFKDYKKVIYLDGDLIVQQGITDLLCLDLGNKCLGAVQDLVVTACKLPQWQAKRNYIVEKQKMQNPQNYFNSGVLVVNVAQLRKEKDFLTKYCQESEFRDKRRSNHDQDSLNFTLENKTLLLAPKYNFQSSLLTESYFKALPVKVHHMLEEAQKGLAIIHYDSDLKPWKYPHIRYADTWWKYARQTPFYEEIIYSQFVSISSLKEVHNLPKYRFLYLKYRVLSNFLWGRRRAKYLRKKKEYQARMDQIKKFIH